MPRKAKRYDESGLRMWDISIAQGYLKNHLITPYPNSQQMGALFALVLDLVDRELERIKKEYKNA